MNEDINNVIEILETNISEEDRNFILEGIIPNWDEQQINYFSDEMLRRGYKDYNIYDIVQYWRKSANELQTPNIWIKYKKGLPDYITNKCKSTKENFRYY